MLEKFYGTNDTITVVLQILSYFFPIVLIPKTFIYNYFQHVSVKITK